MSVKYRNQDGTEVIVAGLTPGGDIEAGAVATRSGQFANATTLSNWGVENQNVVFDTPMPDNDYELEFSYPGDMGYFVVKSKTANGFTGYLQRPLDSASAIGAIRVNYKATKTYTVQHDKQNTEAITAIQAAMPTGAGSGNKLVTASQLTNAITPIANDVDDLKDLIPTGASITNQLVTASQASVDDALNDVSTHAVQNKVVKAALDDKDTTPTENSTKAVTSGGIYNSEQKIRKTRGYYGSKNLINPNKKKVQYSNSINFIVNDDTSVSINGTASSYVPFDYASVILDEGNYILSLNEIQVGLGIRNKAGNAWLAIVSPQSSHGYSKLFTISAEEAGAHAIVLFLENYAQGGTNITAYPMIRLASDEDATWQPYSKSNINLTKTKAEESAIFNTYGSKNILPYPYYETTKEQNGLTFTVNSDGTVLVTGQPTTSSQTNFHLALVNTVKLENGKRYILSGCPEGGGYDKYRLEYSNWSTAGYEDLGNGVIFTEWDPSTYPNQKFNIRIEGGITLPEEGLLFKPMVRLAEVSDDTYVPYAMTNQELSKITRQDFSSTYNTDYISSSSPDPGCYAIKNGLCKEVSIIFSFKDNVTIPANTVLFSLNSDFCPTIPYKEGMNYIHGNIAQGLSTNVIPILITADGNIRLQHNTISPASSSPYKWCQGTLVYI